VSFTFAVATELLARGGTGRLKKLAELSEKMAAQLSDASSCQMAGRSAASCHLLTPSASCRHLPADAIC
jgi:hypothetical protein